MKDLVCSQKSTYSCCTVMKASIRGVTGNIRDLLRLPINMQTDIGRPYVFISIWSGKLIFQDDYWDDLIHIRLLVNPAKFIRLR